MKSFIYIDTIPDEIIEYIGNIRGVISLKSLHDGVFHIQGDKNDIIVKVSDPTMRGDSLWNEYSVVKLIYESKTSVPAPKPLWFYISDNLYFFVEEYLTGDSLRAILQPRRFGCERDIIIKLSYLLRDIHQYSCNQEVAGDFLEQQLELAEEHLKKERVDYSDFANRQEASDILKWLHENKPKSLSCCLLHGDFRPKNILWNGNHISGIIDWEHSFYGDPYYDISIIFYYLNEAERKLFIEHYGLEYLDHDKLEYFNKLTLFLNV